MLGVLSGFSIVWAVIIVGYVVGRTGVLGADARYVLNRLTFFVASPALLFVTVADADPRAVLGPSLAVAAISATGVALLYFGVTGWWLPRGRPERLVGAMSASTVNSANLGLPIAAYVLGSTAHAAPVILFQLALWSPIFLALLDSSTSGRRTTPTALVLSTLRNPMIVASLAGLLFAVFGWTLPQPIADPVELIAGASIPAMLLAFGISLVGSKPLEKATHRRSDVLIGTGLKLIAHPVLAWLAGALLFRLHGAELFAVVIMAALPSAQNVFVTASRYEQGLVVAKDTVLLTTVAAVPAMMLVPLLLGS